MDPDLERDIHHVRVRAPHVSDALARDVANAVLRLREMDLAKLPGVAETIDWANALAFLGAERLDREIAADTLGAVVKDHEDQQLVVTRLAGGSWSTAKVDRSASDRASRRRVARPHRRSVEREQAEVVAAGLGDVGHERTQRRTELERVAGASRRDDDRAASVDREVAVGRHRPRVTLRERDARLDIRHAHREPLDQPSFLGQVG